VREAPFGKGDVISIHYDPMIAKIIVKGKDRAGAIANLKRALDETFVTGPKTNLVFLRYLLESKDFQAGKVNTSFIKNHEAELLPPPKTPSSTTLSLAVLGLLAGREAVGSPDPWNDLSAWRIGGVDSESFAFVHDGKETVITTTAKTDGEVTLTVDGKKVEAAFGASGYDMSFDAKIGGQQYNAVLLCDGRHLTLMYNGHHEDLHYLDPLAFEAGDDDGAGKLTAPMPGKVVAVRVQLGAKVKKGQPLIIVEAMKMEHTITAPADGEVMSIHANVGDQVDEKLELIAFK
jgi:3-methylcrotonyl-CoA carboxylase alpha subunit